MAYRLRNRLKKVLANNKFSDVKFVVGANKKELHAIRALLASISPVFAVMLYGKMKESSSKSVVIIPDISSIAFQSVLTFAYTGDPQLTADTVISVFQIAEKYQMEELKNLCEKYVKDILKSDASPSMLCSWLSDAVRIHSDPLINMFQSFVSEFGPTACLLFKSSGFLTMSLNAMKIFLQCDDLNTLEEDLFLQCEKWVKYQTQNNDILLQNDEDAKDAKDAASNDYQTTLLKQISPFIRFGLMSSEFLEKNVIPYNFLTEKQIESILTTGNDEACHFSTKPRNRISIHEMPFIHLIFEEDGPGDSDYDEYNAEDQDQYKCDQKEDIYSDGDIPADLDANNASFVRIGDNKYLAMDTVQIERRDGVPLIINEGEILILEIDEGEMLMNTVFE